MTTGTAVSVEEYLRTSYKPNCEFVDGVLVPKAMGTRKHSKVQTRIHDLIEKAFPHYEAMTELTLRINDRKYLIPDLAVDLASRPQDPYPLSPVHLCIEILSPGDRVAEAFAKCEAYLAWGVPYAWILDPQTCKAWEYSKESGAPIEIHPADGELAAGEIRILLSEIFAVLSKAAPQVLPNRPG